MEVISYGTQNQTKTVMALGYFDAVHLGHKKLLKKAKQLASDIGCKLSAMIFSGLYKRGGDVFTFDERLKRLENEGVDFVVHANLNTEFMAKEYSTFLQEIFSCYNVAGIVCGEDYTFGKGALGTANVLIEECIKRNVQIIVLDKVSDDNGLKISTSYIKDCLSNGEIKKANALLGDNYFISGQVVKGKRLGNTIGFPTANVEIDGNKYAIKRGVYKTFVIVDGVKYKSITNVGKQPTFCGNNDVIETYISNFNGDLYGKNLIVYFVDYIRDIIKFKNANELIVQLTKDKESLND